MIQTIAAAHNISADELNSFVTGRGWDFSKLDMADASHVKFATDVITGYAQDIAARQAKVAANRAAFTAKWDTKTKAAVANPHRTCKRCHGVGRIVTFSHVNDGQCFRCEGTGVR